MVDKIDNIPNSKDGKNYRPNVAAIVLSAKYPDKCEVFIASRTDVDNAWQFPQGGIDEGETAKEALFRQDRASAIDYGKFTFDDNSKILSNDVFAVSSVKTGTYNYGSDFTSVCSNTVGTYSNSYGPLFYDSCDRANQRFSWMWTDNSGTSPRKGNLAHKVMETDTLTDNSWWIFLR